jgi:hypothetical protein
MKACRSCPQCREDNEWTWGYRYFKKMLPLAVAIFVLFILAILLDFYMQNKQARDFKAIEFEDRINSLVISEETERSNCRIILETGQKYYLPYARNKNYTVPELYRIVREGDWIVKKPNNDTLLVKTGNRSDYLFVIGKVIERTNATIFKQ